MLRLFLAFLAAVFIKSCEGGMWCRPHVSAFLNCMWRGKATSDHSAISTEDANTMVEACYERLDCLKPRRVDSSYGRYGRWPPRYHLSLNANPHQMVNDAVRKCQAKVKWSLASEIQTCMRSAEGWTDFDIFSGITEYHSRSTYSWLPTYAQAQVSVHNFVPNQHQLYKVLSPDSSCSDSERESMVSCLQGVSQKIEPPCESPLQMLIRQTQAKADYCSRIETCSEESLGLLGCASELPLVPVSLCECTTKVAEQRGEDSAEMLSCVESELGQQFVLEQGRAMIRTFLGSVPNYATTNLFCPNGIDYHRQYKDQHIKSRFGFLEGLRNQCRL